ncbi:MAG: AAA family ATPase [Deltaproteobacteria bacterium]|nr:AAA family ATPase [Deltaproteobacteria bacterium]
MKNIPLAVDNFALFGDDNLYYFDKTRLLHDLLKVRGPCFPARPRCFGKTLPAGILERILRGRKELFEGCRIYEADYDWEKSRPVMSPNLIFLTSVGTVWRKTN